MQTGNNKAEKHVSRVDGLNRWSAEGGCIDLVQEVVPCHRSVGRRQSIGVMVHGENLGRVRYHCLAGSVERGSASLLRAWHL